MEEQKQVVEQPKRVSLPTETVNEILGLFSQLPYNQSAKIIQKIQQEAAGIPDIPKMESQVNPQPEG